MPAHEMVLQCPSTALSAREKPRHWVFRTTTNRSRRHGPNGSLPAESPQLCVSASELRRVNHARDTETPRARLRGGPRRR